MTLGELQTAVEQLIRTNSQTAVSPTDDDAFEAEISKAVRRFSALAYGLYVSGATVTYTGGVRVYDLQAVATSKIVAPLSVSVGGSVLRDLNGNVGPVSPKEMRALVTSASGAVKYWCWAGSTQIELDFAPTADFSVDGFREHPVVNEDANLILYSDAMMRPIAAFCAACILRPRAGGTSFEKMKDLDAEAFDQMVQFASDVAAQYGVAPPVLRQVARDA